mmetsp:Transcript_42732/g.102991  ORF Transcript_42732/g.102991 Transcript_42732/m.102991 type:complete len:236 (-) Transcript_42732:648-1355(-)
MDHTHLAQPCVPSTHSPARARKISGAQHSTPHLITMAPGRLLHPDSDHLTDRVARHAALPDGVGLVLGAIDPGQGINVDLLFWALLTRRHLGILELQVRALNVPLALVQQDLLELPAVTVVLQHALDGLCARPLQLPVPRPAHGALRGAGVGVRVQVTVSVQPGELQERLLCAQATAVVVGAGVLARLIESSNHPVMPVRHLIQAPRQLATLLHLPLHRDIFQLPLVLNLPQLLL